MKIVFWGTPDFAVEPLKAIAAAGHEICCVITREDKPRGRGYEMTPTPVKAEAIKMDIPVVHPGKLKDPAFADQLRAYEADVFVVVAYGRIIPKVILDIPKIGCINIHASLLPSYRGAAPIQWAVIDGLKETGITTMFMDEGLDTGDIIKQYKTALTENETGGSLFDRLALMGGEAITDTLSLIEKGTYTRTKQGDTDTAYARMLTKEDGLIDWHKPAKEIERLVRGLSPWPGTYTFYKGKQLKIHSVGLIPDFDPSHSEPVRAGEVFSSGGHLTAACGEGYLEILELQPEGKKRMTADAYLRGNSIVTGDILG